MNTTKNVLQNNELNALDIYHNESDHNFNLKNAALIQNEVIY